MPRRSRLPGQALTFGDHRCGDPAPGPPVPSSVSQAAVTSSRDHRRRATVDRIDVGHVGSRTGRRTRRRRQHVDDNVRRSGDGTGVGSCRPSGLERHEASRGSGHAEGTEAATDEPAARPSRLPPSPRTWRRGRRGAFETRTVAMVHERAPVAISPVLRRATPRNRGGGAVDSDRGHVSVSNSRTRQPRRRPRRHHARSGTQGSSVVGAFNGNVSDDVGGAVEVRRRAGDPPRRS